MTIKNAAACQWDSPCRAPAGREVGRRRFLVATGGCFAALGMFGLDADAAALPVAFAEGVQSGDERRYPIPPTDSVNIDRSAQMIVARYAGHVYVFALSCPHQNAAVKWLAKEQRFQCTKHDSEYKPDGHYTTGHATRNLDRYAVRRDGDSVLVDSRHWFQSDKAPNEWAAATIVV